MGKHGAGMGRAGGRGRLGAAWALAALLAGGLLVLGGCGATTSPQRNEVALPVAPAVADSASVRVESAEGRRTVTVLADEPRGECYRYWGVGNWTQPHRLLDDAVVEEYRGMEPLVRELNLVYLMGGRWEGENEWYKGVDKDGKVLTDFRGMIDQLRAAKRHGYKVRVVLDDVPPTMSDPPQFNVYGNTAPPADERVWHDYVQAAIEAMVAEFGREEVKTWTFRVGTEPDLYPGHWTGTKEQYLSHYDHTVAAVRSALPEARIGPGNILNPGSSGRARRGRPRWGLDIIDHAATGTNAVTGKVGTPIDVFQCSWYAGVGGGLENFDRAFETMRERLDRYEQFRKVPLEAGEYAVLRDDQPRRLYAGETTAWSASFEAALAVHVYDHNVLQMYQWDQATGGVMHPRGRVLEMMERMVGGARLGVSVETDATDDKAIECGALAARVDDRLLVLVYNHYPKRDNAPPQHVQLVVRDKRMQKGQTWRRSQWLVDRDHGVWAYEQEKDCAAAGVERLEGAGRYEGAVLRLYGEAGVPVWKANAAKYSELSRPAVELTDAPITVGNGELRLDLPMPGHSVRLVELQPGK